MHIGWYLLYTYPFIVLHIPLWPLCNPHVVYMENMNIEL